MSTHDRYAIRYVQQDGTHMLGPACKNWGCAVLTILSIDYRSVDAIVINGTPHLLRTPVPAMEFLLQHRAVAEGMVAAADARAAAAFAKAYEPDEYEDAFKSRTVAPDSQDLEAFATFGDGYKSGYEHAMKDSERWPKQAPPASADAALLLIAAERRRQIEMEGWTPEHDDEEHGMGQLAAAAACYALPPDEDEPSDPPKFWPWGKEWWKPGDRVHELTKAGALIVAEIDRLQRAAAPTALTPA